MIIPVKKDETPDAETEEPKNDSSETAGDQEGTDDKSAPSVSKEQKRKNNRHQLTLRVAILLRVMIQIKCHPQVNQLSKACKLKKNKSRKLF